MFVNCSRNCVERLEFRFGYFIVPPCKAELCSIFNGVFGGYHSNGVCKRVRFFEVGIQFKKQFGSLFLFVRP